MAAITIRGIDEKASELLKKYAKKEGTSVNAFLLKLIKEAVGLEKKRRNIKYKDLDHLAGTWNEADLREFEQNTAYFEAIDKNIWK